VRLDRYEWGSPAKLTAGRFIASEAVTTPENAVARVRRARGGETWLPIPDVAAYSHVHPNTLHHFWIKLGRIRR
jgi:hypothetical protein